MMNKLRVIGFARVSTFEQKGNTSLETQEREIKQYCELRGYELVDLVAENESGYKVSRPKFDGVLQRIEDGEADGLIVLKMDRFARNVMHGLRLFEKMQANGWELIMIRDNIDTSTPAGKAFFQMLLVLSEFERNNIVVRVRQGMEAKKERGEYAGGRAPYGWVPHDGDLVVEPGEQLVIAHMRRWKQKWGATNERIANQLNALQVATKSGQVPWSAQMVYRTLKAQYRNVSKAKVNAAAKDADQTLKFKGESFDQTACQNRGCNKFWYLCSCPKPNLAFDRFTDADVAGGAR